MKIKQILATTGLAALLSIGAGVGIAANKGASSVKAEAVASGTITIDLTSGWASGIEGQNISVYFWDNDSHNGWGSYVYAGHEHFLASVDYELDFTPTGMKAVRYDSWYSKEKWEADPWCEKETWGKWNETNDLAYTENGNIIADDDTSFVGFPFVHGKNSITEWNWTTMFVLNNVKANLSGNIEYYADYTFPTGWNEFGVKVNKDWTDWYAYSALTISSNVDDSAWSESSGNIVHNNASEELNIRLYFNRNAGTLFVNDPAHADADEWGQTFLDGMTCDGKGSITKDSWTTLAGTYAVLDDSVKTIYLDIKEDGGDGSIAESAVARYDYIIKKYGTSKYNDFMGRANEKSGIVYPASAITNGLELSNTDNNMIMIIVISASATMLLATALLIIKKRKSHK